MAETLDQMLEPGERVVWRSRWNWVPALWPVALVAVGMLIYLLAWSDHENPLVSVIIIGVMLAAWSFNAFVRWQTSALITDRRVLYRGSYGATQVMDLPLAEVARVEGPDLPNVERRDGRTVLFHDLREGWHFARSLARAAGAPYGPRGRPREVGQQMTKVFAWAGIAVLLFILLTLWAFEISGHWVSAVFAIGLILALGLPEMFGLVAWPFRCLALLALRPVTSAEWARDWLCREAGYRDGKWVQPPGLSLALSWASLIYGQTLPCEDNGAGGEANG